MVEADTSEPTAVAASRLGQWDRDGYFVVRGFAGAEVYEPMLDHVVGVARDGFEAIVHDGKLILPEANLAGSLPGEADAELKVSKIFKLHRDRVFHDFVTSPDLLGLVQPILGADLDCFLSQFIFKNPGAWGQPWHQDEHYFPFDRHPQVGVWLAVTEATLENGCLHVLPGSHREPVHEHVPDLRPGANYGYVEIVDHDMSDAVPVVMEPGDLLVFHSRLMHRSTDNESGGIRAAMVYHYAEHGTIDHTVDSPVNDWMPVAGAGLAAGGTR